MGFFMSCCSPGTPARAQVDQGAEADAHQELVDLMAELGPQFVGEALLIVLTVGQAAATGGLHLFVDGGDDIGHGDLAGVAAQAVAAAGATGAVHQALLAQLGEQLLQIGKGNPLALGDVGQRDGAIVIVQRQIEHGGNRVATFGCQSHCNTLSI